jgi:CxxC-x17-CxxC domain-containing protein
MSQFQANVLSHFVAKDSDAEFQEKTIICNDCGKDFIWSIGEQVFFRDKGLQNPPKRCKPCKQAKNERIEAVMAAQAAGVKQKIEVAVHCAKCNEYTTVPFYPSQGRPVFCRTCFLAMNPEILSPDTNGNGFHPPT